MWRAALRLCILMCILQCVSRDLIAKLSGTFWACTTWVFRPVCSTVCVWSCAPIFRQFIVSSFCVSVLRAINYIIVGIYDFGSRVITVNWTLCHLVRWQQYVRLRNLFQFYLYKHCVNRNKTATGTVSNDNKVFCFVSKRKRI